MPIRNQYIGAPVEKQWAKIVSVDTRSRRIDAQLKDYGIIQVAVWEVPNNFRWPKEKEWWLIVRENGQWHLRAPRQDENAATHIEDLGHGDTLIGTEDASVRIIGIVRSDELHADEIQAHDVRVGGLETSEDLMTSETLETSEGYVGIGGNIDVVSGQYLLNGIPLALTDLDDSRIVAIENLLALLGGYTVTNWTNGANRRTTLDRNSFTNQQLFDFIATMIYDIGQS